MLPTPDPIRSETLGKLHRSAVVGPTAVRELLKRAQDRDVVLGGGINRRSDQRLARILSLPADCIRIKGAGFSLSVGHQLALNFQLDGRRYFFVARVTELPSEDLIDLAMPSAVYVAESREMPRASPSAVPGAPSEVEFSAGGASIRGQVLDWTYHGMAVRISEEGATKLGDVPHMRCINGADAGHDLFATVRHREAAGAAGWLRLGLSVTRVASGRLIDVEAPPECPRSAPPNGLPTPLTASSGSRPVEFENAQGEPLRGIVDQWGDPRGATAVVVPAAWGRTKETLLPLAAAIVESFRGAGRPVVVLRFDGTRRRGESYVPPGCDQPGAEYLQFTFSQAVADTQAAVGFLRRAPEFQCGKVVLVTTSLSAVEGRRVVSADKAKDLAGWISLVGVADLHSALRIISGGVDYGHGLLRGLRFGRQELFGVLVDVDAAGLDSMANGLTFLEDARRDMAAIGIPITWISGRFDGWVDSERVRMLMSCGDTTGRRFLELPIGHQLRSSREAFDVFGFIARSIAEMSLGETIEGRAPDLGALARQRDLERGPKPQGRLRSFWRDFLLGQGEALGAEMLSASDTYRDFMTRQLELLGLSSEQRILDLGSGTGEFSVHLLSHPLLPAGLRVDGVDLVAEAHLRARDRVQRVRGGRLLGLGAIVADLDLTNGAAIPVADCSYDRVLASLLINYVCDPEILLGEILRVLRRSGTAVISSLRRDADISKIYVDAFTDRYSDRAVEVFGEGGGQLIDRSLPSFLNVAARLIDLEDRGRFRFFNAAELRELMRKAGFEAVEIATGLGGPPQAILARGRKG